jgi:hypothetical protein
MGTRSTVKFYSDNEIMVAIYQQYDGYLEGKGKELAEFLTRIRIINGIKMTDNENVANGAGCLAAQYIVAVKKGVGGAYITNLSDEQEYNYRVFIKSGVGFEGVDAIEKIQVWGYDGKKLMFEGNLQEFCAICKKPPKDDE